MQELAKRFLEKEVILYTIHSQQLEGVLKEVHESAVILERKGGELEAINLEYVVRIREYPRNKNGKKKSVVFD